VASELALLAPLLLLFAVGIVDIGLMGAKSFSVTTATSDLCRAIQQDPDLLNDEDACEAYVLAAFPMLADGTLNVEVDADPIQKTTYSHHIYIPDATGAYSDYQRNSTVSSQEFSVELSHESRMFTPLSVFLDLLQGGSVDDQITFSQERRGTIDRTVSENDW